MKSVAIIRKKFSGFTGAVRTIKEHVRCFRRLGYHVDIYAEKVDDEMVGQLGAAAHKVGFWPLVGNRGRPYFNWRVGSIVKAQNYDLVIGHGDIVSQDVLFLHNCTHLAHECIYGEVLPEDDPVGRIHRNVLETQDFRLMMVHTELVKNDIRSRFRVPQEKIEVVYPGYNPAEFSVNASARERIRRALGIGVNQILVGLITSGSFKKRNIELFLKATAEVAKKSPNLIKVLVLGKRATISAHQKLKTDAGLTSAILMEAVTNVDEYFQALDIFVLPAHIEEFGRVVLEAMVYGLPVVVSDRVGGSEILEGLSREGIFKAGNQDLLVNKIYRLVTDTPYRQKMGDQNRQTAQNFTEDIQIEKFADILVKHKLISPTAEMGP